MLVQTQARTLRRVMRQAALTQAQHPLQVTAPHDHGCVHVWHPDRHTFTPYYHGKAVYRKSIGYPNGQLGWCVSWHTTVPQPFN